jgi:hypothetical protein
MRSHIPHLPIVVAVCAAAVTGYAAFSIYAVVELQDPALTGDIIGTWKSFAVLAFGFWIGSSSAGKAKDDEPQQVEVMNPPDNPVPVADEHGGAWPVGGDR